MDASPIGKTCLALALDTNSDPKTCATSTNQTSSPDTRTMNNLHADKKVLDDDLIKELLYEEISKDQTF